MIKFALVAIACVVVVAHDGNCNPNEALDTVDTFGAERRALQSWPIAGAPDNYQASPLSAEIAQPMISQPTHYGFENPLPAPSYVTHSGATSSGQSLPLLYASSQPGNGFDSQPSLARESDSEGALGPQAESEQEQPLPAQPSLPSLPELPATPVVSTPQQVQNFDRFESTKTAATGTRSVYAFNPQYQQQQFAASELSLSRSVNAAELNLPIGADQIVDNNIVIRFSCEGREYGYYADVMNNCQIFHICRPVLVQGNTEMHRFSFFCPQSTIFDQRKHVCVGLNSPDLTPCHLAQAYYPHTVARFAAPMSFGNYASASYSRASYGTKGGPVVQQQIREDIPLAPVKGYTTTEAPIIQQQQQVVEPAREEPVVVQQQTQEPLPQVQEPIPQVQEPLPQVQEPIPQVQEPLLQVQEPIPQVQEPLPVQEPIVQQVQQPAREEPVIVQQEQAPIIQQQVRSEIKTFPTTQAPISYIRADYPTKGGSVRAAVKGYSRAYPVKGQSRLVIRDLSTKGGAAPSTRFYVQQPFVAPVLAPARTMTFTGLGNTFMRASGTKGGTKGVYRAAPATKTTYRAEAVKGGPIRAATKTVSRAVIAPTKGGSTLTTTRFYNQNLMLPTNTMSTMTTFSRSGVKGGVKTVQQPLPAATTTFFRAADPIKLQTPQNLPASPSTFRHRF